MLDMIIAGEETADFTDQIYDLEKEILEGNKPHVWNVHVEGNMERTLEVDFRKFGTSVADLSGIDLDSTSTFAFYAAIDYLKDKHAKK